MHKNRIGHHDLKAANIFLKYDPEYQNYIKKDMDIIKYEFQVVLGDLGLATTYTLDENCVFNMKGTPYYYAPEIWNLREFRNYNYMADIWSVGVLAIYLYFKRFMIIFDSKTMTKDSYKAEFNKGIVKMSDQSVLNMSLELIDFID